MSLMVGDVTVNIFAMLDWLGRRLGGSATEEGAFYKILFGKSAAHALFWPPRRALYWAWPVQPYRDCFAIRGQAGLLGASNGAALGAVMVIYSGLATTLSLLLPFSAALMALLSVLILLALAGRARPACGSSCPASRYRLRRRRYCACA